MRRGRLDDEDVALLARQAVDLITAPTDVLASVPVAASMRIPIDIVADVAGDPDRDGDGGPEAWFIWPWFDGRRGFGVHLVADQHPANALAHLLDGLAECVAETSRFWGRAFPPCPGHTHQASVSVSDDDVSLHCPHTGAEVGRVHPRISDRR